jgi:hypothetical protein
MVTARGMAVSNIEDSLKIGFGTVILLSGRFLRLKIEFEGKDRMQTCRRARNCSKLKIDT